MKPKRLSDAEIERRFWRLPWLFYLIRAKPVRRGAARRWHVQVFPKNRGLAINFDGATRIQAIRRAMAELERRRGK